MSQLGALRSVEVEMDFAEEYLRAKRVAFSEGLCSSTDVVDAELGSAKVRIERLETAYEFDMLLAQLLSVAGAWQDFTDYINRADARAITF